MSFSVYESAPDCEVTVMDKVELLGALVLGHWKQAQWGSLAGGDFGGR